MPVTDINQVIDGSFATQYIVHLAKTKPTTPNDPATFEEADFVGYRPYTAVVWQQTKNVALGVSFWGGFARFTYSGEDPITTVAGIWMMGRIGNDFYYLGYTDLDANTGNEIPKGVMQYELSCVGFQ